MEHKMLNISYVVLQEEELSEPNRRLVEQAKAATQTAYAPYSHFHVGAAVELENGEVVCGSNQENAAYPSGTCAERCAMFYANAAHPDTPVLSMGTIICLIRNAFCNNIFGSLKSFFGTFHFFFFRNIFFCLF